MDGLQGNASRPPGASLRPPPKPNRESASAMLDALVADAAAAVAAIATSATMTPACTPLIPAAVDSSPSSSPPPTYASTYKMTPLSGGGVAHNASSAISPYSQTPSSPQRLVPATKERPPPAPSKHGGGGGGGTGKPPAPPPPLSSLPPPLPPYPSSMTFHHHQQSTSATSLSTTAHQQQNQQMPSSVSTTCSGSATLPAPSVAAPPPPLSSLQSATLPAHMSPPIVPVHRPQWTLSCLRPSPPSRLGGAASLSSIASSSSALSASPPSGHATAAGGATASGSSSSGVCGSAPSSSPLLDLVDSTKSPRTLRRMVHATLPRRKQLYERQKSDDEFLNSRGGGAGGGGGGSGGTSSSSSQNNHPSLQCYDEARAYDDAELLKVIESYCTSAKTRHTVNSLDLTKLSLEEREHALGGGGAGITVVTPLNYSAAATAAAAAAASQLHGATSSGVGLSVVPCHVPGCQHGATPGCEERHPITAPDFRRPGVAGVPGGFCCGAFPITKGIVKGLKRL